MARRPSSQPYYQRVSVPGMAPHFEPMGPPTEDGFLQPAPRPVRARSSGLAWPALRWQPRRIRTVLAVLGTAAGLAAVAALVAGGSWKGLALPAPPWAAEPVQPLPVAQNQLRQLLVAVDDCRGAESLLVMLPEGTERDAALERMQRQQRQTDAWLRDNAAWLAAAHGVHALSELRSAVTAWRQVQLRVAGAEVVDGFNGRARESRSLMAGPSGEAYRRVTGLIERLLQAQPN